MDLLAELFAPAWSRENRSFLLLSPLSQSFGSMWVETVMHAEGESSLFCFSWTCLSSPSSLSFSWGWQLELPLRVLHRRYLPGRGLSRDCFCLLPGRPVADLEALSNFSGNTRWSVRRCCAHSHLRYQKSPCQRSPRTGHQLGLQ